MLFRKNPLQHQWFSDSIRFHENRLVFVDQNPEQEKPKKVETEFLYAGLTNRLDTLDREIGAEADDEKRRKLQERRNRNVTG